MGNLPKEQNAAVKQGEGHDATAPVQKVEVPEPGPGQILVRVFNKRKTVILIETCCPIGKNQLDRSLCFRQVAIAR